MWVPSPVSLLTAWSSWKSHFSPLAPDNISLASSRDSVQDCSSKGRRPFMSCWTQNLLFLTQKPNMKNKWIINMRALLAHRLKLSLHLVSSPQSTRSHTRQWPLLLQGLCRHLWEGPSQLGHESQKPLVLHTTSVLSSLCLVPLCSFVPWPCPPLL
jgi:hypothetical protein